MAEEFHTGGGGGGACSTMSSCWWNTANCATFDVVAPPQPFLCSTTSTAIRDLGHIDQLMINGNQPSFLPVIDDSVDFSVNPLTEAFLPGFFEPPAAAEPMKKVLNYQDQDHDQSSLLQSTSSSSWAYKFMNPNDQFLEVPNYSINIPKQQQVVLSNLCNNYNSTAGPDQLWEPNSANFTPTSAPTQSSVESKCMTKEDRIGSEPPTKKPRIGMLSPLPTFKVRKEKLGDRVTALQQLVSPFGKTDTASVLHEAIEYIKFLHDQVGQVLISPYLENVHHHMHKQSLDHRRKNNGRSDEEDIMNRDLRSRGLCLVPISSTFAFASESPMDFWAPPNYGGSYI